MHARVAVLALVVSAVTAGCGLADTAATTAAQGKAAAENAQAAREAEARLRQQLDAAQATARERLEQAEPAN